MSPGSPLGPRATSAPELKAQIEAERHGRPFFVYRDGGEQQRIVEVAEGKGELWVGRSGSADLRLDFDGEVSGLHAQIEIVGDDCTLVDDGLSRNGSFVNGDRVSGRRRLRDGDVLRFGKTGVLYRAPAHSSAEETVISGNALVAAGVSPAQKRVLVALCRPYKEGAAFATPGDERRHRRRAAPLGRRRQDPPAGAVREVRGRGPAAEPEAGRARRAGAPERARHRARAVAAKPAGRGARAAQRAGQPRRPLPNSSGHRSRRSPTPSASPGPGAVSKRTTAR